MKQICTLILISSCFVFFAKAECLNCSAKVVINKTQTEKFLSHLLMVNSMPLNGYQIATYNNFYDVVRVETDQNYAVTNELTSFDVANKVYKMFGKGSEWDIKKISATVVNPLPDDSLSNVGTIGH